MHPKVNAEDIRIGMFIVELDRPWIDTPFLLQGFLVEGDDQLHQIREHCQWVLIDPHRSSGVNFDNLVNKSAMAPQEIGAEPRISINYTAGPNPSISKGGPAKRPLKSIPTSTDTVSHQIPTSSGNRASRHLEVPARAQHTGDGYAPIPASARSTSGIWSKLRNGVSGFFARSAKASFEEERVAEFASEKIEQSRATFIPETVLLTIYEDKLAVEDEFGAATAAFQRTTDLLHCIVEDIRAGSNLRLESIEEVVSDMVDSMVRNPDALMWVARMREQNSTIYDHGLAVAINLVAFGRHLGYPKDQLSQLGMMGLLLDIGKIKLPPELLDKDARLSSDEFEQIKDHVELGLDVLMQTPNIHPSVLEGIAQHHERMNGTGYPNNLMGDKISVFGRMTAIADTYAAVTKRRPYAEAISPHEALQMLSNWGGTQFHAEMVEQFIYSIGVFPVGSLVELSTGEIAVVVTHSKLKRLRPRVLIVADADKSHCQNPSLRDLLYDVSESPAYIRRGLPSNAYGLDPSDYYLL